jgi:hypothetical protein
MMERTPNQTRILRRAGEVAGEREAAMATTVRVDDVPAERRWVVWTGRVLSALLVLVLAISASMKLSGSPEVMAAFTKQFGYPENALLAIAIAEIGCAVLYVIPPTAVLGAVLITGYLGGAIATHVRVGESFLIPLALGVLAWAGLYLRDRRLQALLPLRRNDGAHQRRP